MTKFYGNALKEKTEFTRSMQEAFSAVDLTVTEFARLLELESRSVVSTVKLIGWLQRGAAPRSREQRETYLAAADRVVSNIKAGKTIQEAYVPGATWITGEEARRRIHFWYNQGMSMKQVYLAGEVEPMQVSYWSSGKLPRVDKAKFELFAMKVTHWFDILKANGSLIKCPGEILKKQLETWKKQGLTLDEIRCAGEISPAMFKLWESENGVPQVHFDRVKMMVDHWIKLKEAWAKNPTHLVPNRRTQKKVLQK